MTIRFKNKFCSGSKKILRELIIRESTAKHWSAINPDYGDTVLENIVSSVIFKMTLLWFLSFNLVNEKLSTISKLAQELAFFISQKTLLDECLQELANHSPQFGQSTYEHFQIAKFPHDENQIFLKGEFALA